MLHDAASAAATTQAIAAVLRTRPAAEWVALLAPAGAAVTIVNHAAQVADDPHVRARGSVVEAAGVPVPASPVRLTAPDGRRTATATEAPHAIGDDTPPCWRAQVSRPRNRRAGAGRPDLATPVERPPSPA